MLAGALCASAQVFNAGQPQRVGADDLRGGLAVISADGSFLITSNAEGLSKVDLATGKARFIASAPWAYNVEIAPDGQSIVFNQAHIGDDKLRRASLECITLADGKQRTVVKPSRNLCSGIVFNNGKVSALESDGKVRSLTLSKAVKARGTAEAERPLLSINYGHLDITAGGETRHLDPLGPGSYLWPSLSPDGSKIVFRCVGEGTYVCNADGSDARRLPGSILMPAWAGNDAIVGVEQTDDSERILTSTLKAVSLKDNAVQTLTDSTLIPMGPTCTADGSVCAFYNGDGALYTIRLK